MKSLSCKNKDITGVLNSTIFLRLHVNIAPIPDYLQCILLKNLWIQKREELESPVDDCKYFLFHSCFKVLAKKYQCFKWSPKLAEMLVNLFILGPLYQVCLCIHIFNNKHFVVFGLCFFYLMIRVRYTQENNSIFLNKRFFL